MTLISALTQLSLAQAGGGAPAPAAGPLDGFVTIIGPVLMFAVIYLLLIRPASKQRREHGNMLAALKKDDEVITSGGIIGRIYQLEDKVAVLEVADKVKIRVLRDRIAGRFNPPQAQTQAQKK